MRLEQERIAELNKQTERAEKLDFNDIARKFMDHAAAAMKAPENVYKDYQLAANELLKVYKPLSADEAQQRFKACSYNDENQLLRPNSNKNTPLFCIYGCGLISVNTYELRDLTKTFRNRTYFELSDIAELRRNGKELHFEKIDLDLEIEAINRYGVSNAFEESKRYKLNSLPSNEPKPQPSNEPKPRPSNEHTNSRDDGPSFGF